MAALKIFIVRYRGIRIKVRVLPTVADVHREYTDGKRLRNGMQVRGFFQPTTCPNAGHIGTIVVSVSGKLAEDIPHEVTHAVLHKMRVVASGDDEPFAYAVGILSARIARKIEALA